MGIPPHVIIFGAGIPGVHADPVTCVMFLLRARFENLEDDRQLTSEKAPSDFRANAGERIDEALARFEMARLEADSVGFDILNFQLSTAVRFRALDMGPGRASRLFLPRNGNNPRNHQQCDSLLGRTRTLGHLAERAPGNIGSVFGR